MILQDLERFINDSHWIRRKPSYPSKHLRLLALQQTFREQTSHINQSRDLDDETSDQLFFMDSPVRLEPVRLETMTQTLTPERKGQQRPKDSPDTNSSSYVNHLTNLIPKCSVETDYFEVTENSDTKKILIQVLDDEPIQKKRKRKTKTSKKKEVSSHSGVR